MQKIKIEQRQKIKKDPEGLLSQTTTKLAIKYS